MEARPRLISALALRRLTPPRLSSASQRCEGLATRAASSPLRGSYTERRLVPFATPHIFRVVADVAAYRRFVPWCIESTVTQRAPAGDYLEAELAVGFRLFAERYTSRVSLERDRRVVARAMDTRLFARLENEWTFAPGPSSGGGGASTWLGFAVDFEFRSMLYARASNLFFDEVVHKMVAAFEERARVTLGEVEEAQLLMEPPPLLRATPLQTERLAEAPSRPHLHDTFW